MSDEMSRFDRFDRLSAAIEADDAAEAESAVEGLASDRLRVIKYAFLTGLICSSSNVCRSMFDAMDSASRLRIRGVIRSYVMDSSDPLETMRLLEELYGDVHVDWSKVLEDPRDWPSSEKVSPGRRAAILWLAARFKELHPESAELVDAKVREFEEWLESR